MWLYIVSYTDHQIYKFLQFNDGAKVLSDVTRGLVLSSDNPLDFDAEIWILLPNL